MPAPSTASAAATSTSPAAARCSRGLSSTRQPQERRQQDEVRSDAPRCAVSASFSPTRSRKSSAAQLPCNGPRAMHTPAPETWVRRTHARTQNTCMWGVHLFRRRENTAWKQRRPSHRTSPADSGNPGSTAPTSPGRTAARAASAAGRNLRARLRARWCTNSRPLTTMLGTTCSTARPTAGRGASTGAALATPTQRRTHVGGPLLPLRLRQHTHDHARTHTHT